MLSIVVGRLSALHMCTQGRSLLAALTASARAIQGSPMTAHTTNVHMVTVPVLTENMLQQEPSFHTWFSHSTDSLLACRLVHEKHADSFMKEWALLRSEPCCFKHSPALPGGSQQWLTGPVPCTSGCAASSPQQAAVDTCGGMWQPAWQAARRVGDDRRGSGEVESEGGCCG